MKDCRKVRERLAQYLDEDLSPELQDHLAGCEDCTRFFKELKAGKELLQRIDSPPPPPDLQEKILRRVLMDREQAENKSKRWWNRPVQLNLGSVLAVLLVVLIMGGIGVVYFREDNDQRLMPAWQIDLYTEEAAPMARRLTLEDVKEGFLGEGVEVDRKIIYTASMEIEVLNIEEAQNVAIEYATQMGGFVAEARRWEDNNGRLYLRLVLRIPVGGFEKALLDLAVTGDLKDQSVQGRDITMEFYDLEARLESKVKQEARYHEILTNATTVEEVLKVERELERIRSDIESLQGRLRYYRDRTDLSTITVLFMEPAQSPIQVFNLSGLFQEMIKTFMESLETLLVVGSKVLPWLIVLGLALLVIRLFKK